MACRTPWTSSSRSRSRWAEQTRRRDDTAIGDFHPFASNLGAAHLSKSHAAFDPRDYGHAKLGELVRAEPYVDEELRACEADADRRLDNPESR